ncbi:MAG: DUF2510 domain-containing protein [Coriobacteriales bacterium]|jgi:hypothetical protein|nr:DUF2510 domain-containing protein [Coriobacteriales bacterium]
MADTQTPAGWYADPAGDTTKLRYWDGASWTEQTTDAKTSSGGMNSQTTTSPISASTPPPAFATNPYQQGVPGVAPIATDQSGSAVTSLICGIIGIIGAVLIALAGYVLGIVAIVMGMKGRTSAKGNLATVGIVLGIISLVIALINSVLGVLLSMGNLPF